MGKIICSILVLCFLSGCAQDRTTLNVQVTGGSRWPRIRKAEKLSYTEEEKKKLAEFNEESPELARKIVNRLTEARAKEEAYDIERWKHNVQIMRNQGYNEEEIFAIEGPDPRGVSSDVIPSN